MAALSGRAGPWPEALAAAREGRLETARAIARAVEERPPFPAAPDFLIGRCLAEAGLELPEAVQRLRSALAAGTQNVLGPAILALACLRAGDETEAAALLRRSGLPHDLDLLGQLALTLETLCRPWPASLPVDWPSYPEAPGRASAEPPNGTGAPLPEAPAARPRPRWRRASLLRRMQSDLEAGRLGRVAESAATEAAAGFYDSDVELLAGLACEEAGDGRRARRHLARSLALDPRQFDARTFLGRVYWRDDWFDLAEDLWRSLPVEGPDDFGRHYHLALAHEAAGRRAEALEAMGVALKEFYVETREFYIERVFARWLRRLPAADGEPDR